jgi:hypothetical protein
MGTQQGLVRAATIALWVLVLCDCSAASTKPRGAANNGTQTGNAGSVASSGSAGTTGDTGSFGNATGSGPSLGTAQPSQPAAPTGTVSKINTRTLEELGRYKTRPDGQGRPSRTSVAQDGDVAVANRDGGVTKIYASLEKCKDKNGNGKIDTSTGKADVKAWGEDECVAWHTPIAYYSNRPMAWAPPSAPDAPAKLWTSAANTCSASACSVDVMRLNGETGVIEDTITVGGLNGVDFISASSFGGAGGGLLGSFLSAAGFAGTGVANYGAYGGASDARGNLWLFIANTTQLVRIDAASLQFRVWSVPMGNGYGITVDHVGRVFICGALGVSRFDPATELWETTSVRSRSASTAV